MTNWKSESYVTVQQYQIAKSPQNNPSFLTSPASALTAPFARNLYCSIPPPLPNGKLLGLTVIPLNHTKPSSPIPS